MSIRPDNEAVELTPIAKHLEMIRDVEKAISTIEYIYGKELFFNPCKETIIRLQGFLSGCRHTDHVLDL